MFVVNGDGAAGSGDRKALSQENTQMIAGPKTRKKGLIGLAFLCVTIPLVLVAQLAEKKTLVGVWEV